MSKRCCAQSCYNSQMKNRMVHYFGFPKNEDYARKWAIAAGREDLLVKPIQNVIKYFLCSSHFTNDCFQDPPLNSKLKKTLRPVTVPIPTIFVSNIEQYMPGEEESLGYDDLLSTTNDTSPKNVIWSQTDNPLNESLIESPSTPEMVPIYLDEYETPSKKKCGATLLSDPDLELEEHLEDDEESSNEVTNHTDDYYLKLLKLNSNKNTNQPENFPFKDDCDEFTCRLCASDFFEEQLIFFQDDDNLINLINSVLPRSVIQSDDYLPQQICISCLNKVQKCHNIMNDFEEVQTRLVGS